MLLAASCRLESTEVAEFLHTSTHCSGTKITEIALMGQRCSGTNFLQYLIQKNFPGYFFHCPNGTGAMPHKHHWPFLNGSKNYPFFKNDHCLFVLIVRDPYSWLQSLYEHRELLAYLKRNTFANFLASKVVYQKFLPYGEKVRSFPNILSARNQEIENYFKIGARVGNFVFVSYDKINAHPQEFVNFLSEYFQLEKTEEFVPVNKYKGFGVPYTEKQYAPIISSDLLNINQSLNWTLENSMDFHLQWGDS